MSTSTGRLASLLPAARRGAAAGLIGVAVMTAGEKLEQAVTHRPDSYVPARALLRLAGQQPRDTDQPLVWNHAMHWGTGVTLGVLRGVWAVIGLRGTRAHLVHTMVRLATDQTLENATGVGAPPHTWPVREQVIDVLLKHKQLMQRPVVVKGDRAIIGRPKERVRQLLG